jgi:hypothetical protein
MAVVVSLNWEGVSPEQYEGVIEELGLDEDSPNGGMLHVAGFMDGALRVIDVWESGDAFGRFQEERLVPAVQKVGIETEPQAEVYPVHNVYVPAGERVAELGATSLPA